jgi:hypothetical protein
VIASIVHVNADAENVRGSDQLDVTSLRSVTRHVPCIVGRIANRRACIDTTLTLKHSVCYLLAGPKICVELYLPWYA